MVVCQPQRAEADEGLGEGVESGDSPRTKGGWNPSRNRRPGADFQGPEKTLCLTASRGRLSPMGMLEGAGAFAGVACCGRKHGGEHDRQVVHVLFGTVCAARI